MANKPLGALTPKEQSLIVRNVISACKDITKLNGTGYNFLYLCNGFIAHHSIYWFKKFYRIPGTLCMDITRFASWNQWDNFWPGQEHYEYYMSKKAVYNAILAGLA